MDQTEARIAKGRKKKNVLGTHPKGLDPGLIIVIKNGSNRPGFSIL